MRTHPTRSDRTRLPPALRLVVVPELPRPVRRAVAGLWLAGAALAGGSAPVAAVRDRPGSGLVYGVVATTLIVLALATAGAARWALRVSVVLLALQLLGAIGSGWELVHGVAGSKAHELRELGVDPTLGVALNFVYSVAAFGLFVWAWRAARR